MSVDQEKIQGRLVAIGRAKYSDKLLSDGAGYAFVKGGFKWEIDPLDQDAYGITADALNDCVEQLDKMGSADKIKGSEHMRQHQGWMNAGIVIQSKLDPRISMMVTLVDQEFEDADVTLRWFVDLNRVSPSARGPAERSVDAEELKAVERARDMSKKESIEALFDLPIKDTSSTKKVMKESFDAWGIPMVEDVESGVTGHVGIDAIEKPKEKIGDKDREESSGKSVKVKLADPETDPAKREKVDGKGQAQVGGADKMEKLPDSKVKPAAPDETPKHVGEDVEDGHEGHVGVDAIEKPKTTVGKEYDEVGGEAVKVKPAAITSTDKKHVDGSDQAQVGAKDVAADLPAAKVKPASPEESPKLMAERAKIRAARMKQYESYLARKAAVNEDRKKRFAKIGESKKKALGEGVEHPVKVVEKLKKHVDEAHRAIKKAHHLTEWAHKKMGETHAHLPAAHAEKVHGHGGKMEAATQALHEAKKHLGEVCESVSGMHLHMKKK